MKNQNLHAFGANHGAPPTSARMACFLRAYKAELRNGHSVYTAAQNFYFAMLEQQRRLDILEIHSSAVAALLVDLPEPASAACANAQQNTETDDERTKEETFDLPKSTSAACACANAQEIKEADDERTKQETFDLLEPTSAVCANFQKNEEADNERTKQEGPYLSNQLCRSGFRSACPQVDEPHPTSLACTDVRKVSSISCVSGSAPDPTFRIRENWRFQANKRKAEAIESLAERAQQYAIGKPSMCSGLLCLAENDTEKETLVERFSRELDDEYEAATQEIEASLDSLAQSGKEAASTFLGKLRQSSHFWHQEMATTSTEWEKTSKSMHEGGERLNCIWDALAQNVERLLACASTHLPLDEDENGITPSSPVARSVSADLSDSVLVEVCSRLFEIELYESAHGFSHGHGQRQELLNKVLQQARKQRCMPRIAQNLLTSADFCSLAGLRLTDDDSPFLSKASAPSQPWAEWLRELFDPGPKLFGHS